MVKHTVNIKLCSIAFLLLAISRVLVVNASGGNCYPEGVSQCEWYDAACLWQTSPTFTSAGLAGDAAGMDTVNAWAAKGIDSDFVALDCAIQVGLMDAALIGNLNEDQIKQIPKELLAKLPVLSSFTPQQIADSASTLDDMKDDCVDCIEDFLLAVDDASFLDSITLGLETGVTDANITSALKDKAKTALGDDLTIVTTENLSKMSSYIDVVEVDELKSMPVDALVEADNLQHLSKTQVDGLITDVSTVWSDDHYVSFLGDLNAISIDINTFCTEVDKERVVKVSALVSRVKDDDVKGSDISSWEKEDLEDVEPILYDCIKNDLSSIDGVAFVESTEMIKNAKSEDWSLAEIEALSVPAVVGYGSAEGWSKQDMEKLGPIIMGLNVEAIKTIDVEALVSLDDATLSEIDLTISTAKFEALLPEVGKASIDWDDEKPSAEKFLDATAVCYGEVDTWSSGTFDNVGGLIDQIPFDDIKAISSETLSNTKSVVSLSSEKLVDLSTNLKDYPQENFSSFVGQFEVEDEVKYNAIIVECGTFEDLEKDKADTLVAKSIEIRGSLSEWDTDMLNDLNLLVASVPTDEVAALSDDVFATSTSARHYTATQLSESVDKVKTLDNDHLDSLITLVSEESFKDSVSTWIQEDASMVSKMGSSIESIENWVLDEEKTEKGKAVVDAIKSPALWGEVGNWEVEKLDDLGYIVKALEVADLKEIKDESVWTSTESVSKLSSNQIGGMADVIVSLSIESLNTVVEKLDAVEFESAVSSLGQERWDLVASGKDATEVLFDRLTSEDVWGQVDTWTSEEVASMGSVAVGIKSEEIGSIQSDVFVENLEALKNGGHYSKEDQLSAFSDKAREALCDTKDVCKVEDWTKEDVEEHGVFVAGLQNDLSLLSEEAVKGLNSIATYRMEGSDLDKFSADSISNMKPETKAEFNGLKLASLGQNLEGRKATGIEKSLESKIKKTSAVCESITVETKTGTDRMFVKGCPSFVLDTEVAVTGDFKESADNRFVPETVNDSTKLKVDTFFTNIMDDISKGRKHLQESEDFYKMITAHIDYGKSTRKGDDTSTGRRSLQQALVEKSDLSKSDKYDKTVIIVVRIASDDKEKLQALENVLMGPRRRLLAATEEDDVNINSATIHELAPNNVLFSSNDKGNTGAIVGFSILGGFVAGTITFYVHKKVKSKKLNTYSQEMTGYRQSTTPNPLAQGV